MELRTKVPLYYMYGFGPVLFSLWFFIVDYQQRWQEGDEWGKEIRTVVHGKAGLIPTKEASLANFGT